MWWSLIAPAAAESAQNWRQVHLQPDPPQARSLAALSAPAAEALSQSGERVSVFESTTGGLINAALLAAPGASSFTSCGAVTYTSSRSVAVLGPEAAQPLGEPLDSQGHRCRPQSGKEYVASKQERARLLARQKRHEVGATWCVCENGACGPTFPYADVDAGFTAIFVSGPVERGVLVRSVATYSREENMWAFTNAALDLLVECMAEARAQGLPAALPPAAVLETREDRFGGVEVHVRDSAAAQVSGFWTELRAALEAWRLAGKRGIWLRLPLACHTLVSAAISAGFAYHHATPQYVLLTRWLPASPSPLPRYGFTLIGVGGVVLNSRDEVLMVQEAISPTARTQGAWKIPGGLADPGEDFAETASREVREECGLETELEGVVSLRHSHGRRFGQGDVYVVTRLRATSDALEIDRAELQDARWMSRKEIHARRETPDDRGKSLDGKVSMANWEMIDNALSGRLVDAVAVPDSKGVGTMLYKAVAP